MLEEAIALYLGQEQAPETAATKADKPQSPFGELDADEQRRLEALLNYLRDDSRPFREYILGIMASALGLTPEEVRRKPKRKTG